jgi:hypothetical protein
MLVAVSGAGSCISCMTSRAGDWVCAVHLVHMVVHFAARVIGCAVAAKPTSLAWPVATCVPVTCHGHEHQFGAQVVDHVSQVNGLRSAAHASESTAVMHLPRDF